jgi:hypothetical protein
MVCQGGLLGSLIDTKREINFVQDYARKYTLYVHCLYNRNSVSLR